MTLASGNASSEADYLVPTKPSQQHLAIPTALDDAIDVRALTGQPSSANDAWTLLLPYAGTHPIACKLSS